MTNSLTCGPALWAETMLANRTNPNSAEKGRERYFDAANAGYMDNGLKACLRTPYVIPGGLTRPGFMAPGFVEDFYYRIHLDPRVIDAGLLSTDTDYDVTLWNAWLTQSVIISSINSSQDGGMVFDKTPPLVLMPLADIVIKLTLTLSGPPTQDAEVTFVTTTGDIGLHVYASRILQFDFEPDWQSGFNFKMVYGTILTKLGRCKEQRRAKSTYPTFEMAFTIWHAGQKGRDLSNVLETAFDRVLAIPVYSAGETVLAQPGAKSLITKPFSDNWFFVRWAQMAALFDYKNNQQQVLSISGKNADMGQLDFMQDIKLEHVSAVYPCMPAYLEPVSISHKTHDLSQAKVNVKGYVNGADKLFNVPALPDVFPFKFNFAAGIGHTFDTQRALSGFDGGINTLSPLIKAGFNKLTAEVNLFSRADELAVLDFFTAAHGRQHTFKLLSPVVMFETARAYIPGQAVINVKGRQNTALNRRNPLVFWYDDDHGTKTTVAATGLVLKDDGTSDLYLAAPFPYSIKAGAKLGRVYNVRFDDDVLDISYKTAHVAKIKFTFREVEE